MIAQKFVTASAFRDLARRGETAGVGVRTDGLALKTPTGNSRVVPWVLSDGSVDRAGDTVNPNGWDIAAFRRNNVVLWGHDSSQPPIGRASSVRSDGSRLLADIEFAPPETSSFAETVFQLVKGGFIKAGSVGFIPIDYEFSKDKNRPNGIDFKQQELIEFSICSVPANVNALAEARAKGLNVAPLQPQRKARTMAERIDAARELQIEICRDAMRHAQDEWTYGCALRKLRRIERAQHTISARDL
jgi:HK97 family phage prohead protease